jgi:hypothetical protein
MATMAKILIAAALAAGVGGGVTFAHASDGRDDPVGDVRGPCDEAEHRNDPRCVAGAAQAREDRAEADGDRQRRKRNRGSNRGRSGKSGHSGPGRSGSGRSGSSSGRG